MQQKTNFPKPQINQKIIAVKITLMKSKAKT